MTRDSASYDFFISYAGADRAWAEWVAWQLEDPGYRTLIQAWDFRPGMNFVRAMRQALDGAQRMLAIVSAAYLASIYGNDEWTAAFTREESDEAHLIYVRVEEVEMPRMLQPWIFIDLVGCDRGTATNVLLTGIQRGRSKPPLEPPFPRLTSAREPRYPRSDVPTSSPPGSPEADLTELRLPTFFQRCGFPLLLLEGDGRYEYRLRSDDPSPIAVHLAAQGKFLPPEPWPGRFRRVLERKLERVEGSGEVLFNGDLVRIRDWQPYRDEQSGLRSLRLEAEPTDYYTFISSNHGLDDLDPKHATALRAQEQATLHSLRSSVLANPLTVSVCLVLHHRGKAWILIQERNTEKTFHGKQRFQCSAAGMVSLHRDRDGQDIDVFATAVNEIEEELGLRLQREQIVFLGFLRETRLREIGLVAEAHIHADPAAVLRPSADAFEVRSVLTCPFTPEDFGELVRRHGSGDNFTALGAGAIICSLLRHFLPERVEAAFRN